MTRRGRNSKLFTCGSSVNVDLSTGETTPIEGGGLQMLPGPPGTCEWCHVIHDPGKPHNKQSLAYQIKFQTIHGRPPTWSDAMAHCDPEVKTIWRQHLRDVMMEHGLTIPEDLK